MDRVPLIVYATVFAVISVLAVSSIYVTEQNDAAMKSAGTHPAPLGQQQGRSERPRGEASRDIVRRN